MHKNRISLKRCAKCKKEKVLNDFGRDASRQDGRYSYCKSCRRKPNRLELEIEELAAKGLKKCTLCFAVKPFCAYQSDQTKRFGISSRCKKCHSEQRKLKHKEWHAKRNSFVTLYAQGQSVCYKCGEIKNFDRFLKSNSTRTGVFNLCLDCNNTKRREYNRKRSKANRDYVRWEVFEADNFTCYICEDILSPDTLATDPKSLSIDHVVPIAKGGLDERDNVRTACLDCNRRKNDMSLEDFLDRMFVSVDNIT